MKAVWLQGVTCNGNTHSFLNYENLDFLLDKIEFLYHPLLPSRYNLLEISRYKQNIDILIVEGGLKENFLRGGHDLNKLFNRFSKKARYIVAIGSCASFGGVFKEYDENIKGVGFDRDIKYKDIKNLINIPGCPAHPEWIAYVLLSIVEGRKIIKDSLGRPKEIFAYTVHTGCTRNEYFEWKIDAKSFGLKEGCLFYEQGCQAPFTSGSCNKILWNEVNSKTRAGMPCVGCTEPSFPKENLFKTKTYMGIPADMPLGVPKRAYLTITGIAKSFKIDRLNRKLF